MQKKSFEALKRLDPESFRSIPKNPIILCADNIRSGHNVGALFRIADAFCLESVILGPQCPKPPNPEIQKSALGAQEHVFTECPKSLSDWLLLKKQEAYTLIGVEQTENSVSLLDFIPDRNTKYVLVLGHEVTGISEELLQHLDFCIEIPQMGVKHSLNVSVAAGIVAWHLVQNWIR